MRRRQLDPAGQVNPRRSKELFKTAEYVHTNPEAGITIIPLPYDIEKLAIISYGDSSWANNKDLTSQTGLAICLSTKDSLQGSALGTLLDWKSSRTKRVVRSTLAEEAGAADNAVDHGAFVQAFLREVMTQTPHHLTKEANENPCLIAVTDCRSLYDCLTTASPNSTEKRVLLDIISIRQTAAMFSWIPTHLQVADVLTKRSSTLRQSFADWLDKSTCVLADGSTNRFVAKR